MATITVTFGADVLNNIKLEKDCLIVGRDPEADIHLDNLMISRRHAVIYQENGVWFIKDLSGKNGVFVNGRQVNVCPLHDKDTAELGKYMLVFRQSMQELDRDRELARKNDPHKHRMAEMVNAALSENFYGRPKSETQMQETTALSTGQINSIRQEMNKRRRPHLVSTGKNPGRIYPLDKRKTLIGCAPECDIVIERGLTIGKEHAVINETGESFVLTHVSGLAGVKVNGKKIGKDKHFLNDGDRVEIGENQFQFVSGLDPVDATRRRIT